jgi:hypothetical protein
LLPVRKPVDEVKAPEAEEALAYPLTRDELLVLARYWAKETLKAQLYRFFVAYDYDWRLLAYAPRRLDRIADQLDPDAVRGAVAEAEEEARRGISDEEWRVFTEGTGEEWDRALERAEEDAHYLHRKCLDKETQERAFAHLRDHPGQVYLDEAGDLWWLSEPFRGSGVPAGRLVLRVTIPRGEPTFALGYALEKPPEWCPPYGLR